MYGRFWVFTEALTQTRLDSSSKRPALSSACAWVEIATGKLSGAHAFGASRVAVRVAVGISVARYPPHRSPQAALPHEALILDEWRQSECWGKDVGRAELGPIAPPVDASSPSSDNPSGRDGSKPAATAELPDSGIRGG